MIETFDPFSAVREAISRPFREMAISYAKRLMEPVPTYGGEVVNVEDAKSIEVGKVYNVLVVIAKDQPIPGMVLPILGPLHDDREIPEMDAAAPHWHTDWRFIPDGLFRPFCKAWGMATGGAPEDLPNFLMHQLIQESGIQGPPERRALRCARTHSHFALKAQEPWLGKLEEACAGKKVCDNICPHRGFSLVGAYEDPAGARYCPGHGLAFSSKTGELVRRAS